MKEASFIWDHKETEEICFSRVINKLGCFTLRPFKTGEDVVFIHDWVNRDYAKYWGMQGTTVEQVREAYIKICSHSKVFIGSYNGNPAFLMEMYNATEDPLKEYYDAVEGDYGMHVLVAPAERPVSNFTWYVFTTIMDYMFSLPEVKRVVVEPDIRNEKIHILNKRAGFEYQKVIELPQKTAHLAFCTRDRYAAALIKESLIQA